jgi:hypothetical protein
MTFGQRSTEGRVSMSKLGFVLLAGALMTCSSAARSEEADSQLEGVPILYVGKFTPIEQSPAGFGPLHALNSDIRRRKADTNAARLSSALIDALKKRQVRAESWPSTAEPRPTAGWLIQGVYYGMDQNSRLISVPLASSNQGPNVEVTVTVADCARDPGVPFAVIGTDAVLKGQGTALSWNPYVAAAKFVAGQVQGQDSISVLANQIADKILDERHELVAHDLAK